jgi:hypothetical protein
VKLSLGLGYLRILKLRHLDPRWERFVCYAIILFSCAMNSQHFFYAIFRCAGKGFTPAETASAIATGRCSLMSHGYIISAFIQNVTNVIVDWTLVLLPIPSIFGSIMDKHTRLALIGILVLGAA